LWKEIELLKTQIAGLEERLPEFRRMAIAAEHAHANRDIAPATYQTMEASLIAREGELLDLQSALWLDSITLHTILGAPYVMPSTRGEP
jgi:hypothetical protein